MSALPFGWVFSLFFCKRKLLCLVFDIDMRILIVKALKLLYTLQKYLLTREQTLTNLTF